MSNLTTEQVKFMLTMMRIGVFYWKIKSTTGLKIWDIEMCERYDYNDLKHRMYWLDDSMLDDLREKGKWYV